MLLALVFIGKKFILRNLPRLHGGLTWEGIRFCEGGSSSNSILPLIVWSAYHRHSTYSLFRIIWSHRKSAKSKPWEVCSVRAWVTFISIRSFMWSAWTSLSWRWRKADFGRGLALTQWWDVRQHPLNTLRLVGNIDVKVDCKAVLFSLSTSEQRGCAGGDRCEMRGRAGLEKRTGREKSASHTSRLPRGRVDRWLGEKTGTASRSNVKEELGFWFKSFEIVRCLNPS